MPATRGAPLRDHVERVYGAAVLVGWTPISTPDGTGLATVYEVRTAAGPRRVRCWQTLEGFATAWDSVPPATEPPAPPPRRPEAATRTAPV